MQNVSSISKLMDPRHQRAVWPCPCAIPSWRCPRILWCHLTPSGMTNLAKMMLPNSPRTSAITPGAVCIFRKLCTMPDASVNTIPGYPPTAPSAWTNSGWPWPPAIASATTFMTPQKCAKFFTQRWKSYCWNSTQTRQMPWSTTTTYSTKTTLVIAPRIKMQKILVLTRTTPIWCTTI